MTEISPQQYGCILMTIFDIVEYLVLGETDQTYATQLLLILEKLLDRANSDLSFWVERVSSISDNDYNLRSKLKISKKRPIITQADLQLLLDSINMSLYIISRLRPLASDISNIDEKLERIAQVLTQSRFLVDGKADIGFTVPAKCNINEEKNTEGDDLLRTNMYTYAEARYIKIRRSFKDLLSERLSQSTTKLVLPRLNPAILGVFHSDIVLTYDAEGANLLGSVDMDVSLPYHHLMRRDIFPKSTFDNSQSLRHVVLDIEKRGQIYTANLGLDYRLQRKIKYNFLRRALGSHNVGMIWNREELKIESKFRKRGIAQESPEELKEKKILFLNISLNQFENFAVLELVDKIFEALNFNNMSESEDDKPRENKRMLLKRIRGLREKYKH